MPISAPTMSRKAVVISTQRRPKASLREGGGVGFGSGGVEVTRYSARPSAAGGTDRPTNPASATIVRT